MTIRAKAANSPADLANFFPAIKIYIILHTENILEIRETGSQILD